jgi:hypothetical protein
VGTCPVSPKKSKKVKNPSIFTLCNARNLENYPIFFNLSNFKTIGRKFSKTLQEVSLSNQNIKGSSIVIILIFCL